MADPHNAREHGPSSLPLRCLAFALLFALSFGVLSLAHEDGFEERLNSDEPEWVAISILHWNQFVRGAEPGGVDVKPGDPGDSPWKQGVQHTTFGYMNPCLPKLIWGGIFAAAGHTQASPYAFQTFHKGDPQLGRGPYADLMQLMPLARRVVLALAALSGALLFFVARATAGGRRSGPDSGSLLAGNLAGGTALALWLASPLVLRTATYIRTDHFMLPFVLGLWLWTLARRDALSGQRGLRPALLAGFVAGSIGGLGTSSKLNGALALIAFAAAVLAHWAHRRRSPAGGAADPSPASTPVPALAAIALAGATSLLVFFALNPLLWSGPLAGVEDILARWDKLMSYFQDEWAPKVGTEVAHGRGASLALFFDRTAHRDEPLAAYTGLRFGWIWIVAGAGALVATAWGRGPLAQAARSNAGAALGSLCFVAALVLGTALWLPLDWERLFLPSVPAFAVLGGTLVATLAAALRRNPAR